MSRAIRYVHADDYYLLTNRSLMGQHLMVPDPECRRIVRACLARAADALDVELVCFVFMSNHFHLIARFPHCRRAEFMERFQGQLAERLNKHRGRKGTVFPDPYDARALLDDQTLRDKIAYVLNNPVRADLVARAEDWREVSSMGLHLADDDLHGRWLDYTYWRKLRRRKADYDREDAMRDHFVELHLPDALDDKDGTSRLERLREVVARGRRLYHVTCGGHGPDRSTDVLGFEAAADQDWRNRSGPPDSSSDGRRILGIASDPEVMADYHDKRRAIDRAYRNAWERAPNVPIDAFPDGTHPPGCHRCIPAPPEPSLERVA